MNTNVEALDNTTKKSASDEIRIPIQELKNIVCELLVANHLPSEQAEVIADCFVEADACGVPTHGVAILPTHINKLRSGGYNLAPTFKVMREGGAFSVINADNAIGTVSAAYCMRYTMERCRRTGIFTVFSRNSNTYGPAFYYPLLAAQNGLIGITFCNSPAAMPAWNGKQKLLGTNPFAMVVPCKTANPIIYDTATSKVAKSKINEARIKGEQIPLGWALDEEGNPTTDPIEAIRGLVLPMGEHKGYGLALTIDILAGVLSGAAFLNNVGKFYSEDNKCMDVGQAFIAIDPVQIYGEEFYELMDDYAATVHRSPGIYEKTVRLPGDNKADKKRDSIENGVKLPMKTIEELNQCLDESGLSVRLQSE